MSEEMRSDIMKASKYVHCKIDAAINAMLSNKDLTAAQSHVLMCLMKSGDAFSSDIHRRLNISRATVSGLIKKLRANGYITFEGCEKDERHKKIVVTQKAIEHKAEIDRCMNGIEDVVFSDFSQEEIEEMHRLMGKMAKNINNIKKGGI